MKPQGKAKELFDAYSRINAKAYQNQRLVSCQVLSKGPNYDDVLRRFLTAAPIRRISILQAFDLTLRYYLINFAHIAALLLGRIALRLSGWKAPDLKAGTAKLLLLDTFLVMPKVIERKRFTELYLPGLADEAAERGWSPVYLFRLYGSRDPRKLFQAFKVMARENIAGLTELHLFTFTDWLRLIRHWLLYPVAHWSLVHSLKKAAPGSPESYIRDALVHCLANCQMIGEARRLTARRIAALLPEEAKKGARVIAWYENQTVNKAFHLGLAQAAGIAGRKIPVIGAQLLIWPDTLLNNHADDAEAPNHLAPDRVLVNGACFLPEESTQNYGVGPSMRYGELFAQSALTPDPQKPILVLLSYHPVETERILRLVKDAGIAEQVIYKFHPAAKPDAYRHLLPQKPKLVDGTLYSVLGDASLVLGSGSGSLAEAAALGLPVISVDDPLGIAGLSLNYLPEQGRGTLWTSVREASELPGAIENLQTALSDDARRQEARAFRDLLFTEPTPERIAESFEL